MLKRIVVLVLFFLLSSSMALNSETIKGKTTTEIVGDKLRLTSIDSVITKTTMWDTSRWDCYDTTLVKGDTIYHPPVPKIIMKTYTKTKWDTIVNVKTEPLFPKSCLWIETIKNKVITKSDTIKYTIRIENRSKYEYSKSQLAITFGHSFIGKHGESGGFLFQKILYNTKDKVKGEIFTSDIRTDSLVFNFRKLPPAYSDSLVLLLTIAPGTKAGRNLHTEVTVRTKRGEMINNYCDNFFIHTDDNLCDEDFLEIITFDTTITDSTIQYVKFDTTYTTGDTVKTGPITIVTVKPCVSIEQKDSVLIKTIPHIKWLAIPKSKIELEYHPRITPITNGIQGNLVLVLHNPHDSLATPKLKLVVKLDSLNVKQVDSVFYSCPIQSIAANQTDTILVRDKWNVKQNNYGKYVFKTSLLIDDVNSDKYGKVLKTRLDTIYTIPKWNGNSINIVENKPHEIFTQSYSDIKIPVIPYVFFGPNSSTVDKTYLTDTLRSPLPTLAKRLQANRDLIVHVEGMVDTMSVKQKGLLDKFLVHKINEKGWENFKKPVTDSYKSVKQYIDLANDRAKAVKDVLVDLGVDPSQVKVVMTQNIYTQKADQHSQAQKFSKWFLETNYINQENRCARLLTQSTDQDEIELFKPVPVDVEESSNLRNVLFNMNVLSFAPVVNSNIKIADKTGFIDELESNAFFDSLGYYKVRNKVPWYKLKSFNWTNDITGKNLYSTLFVIDDANGEIRTFKTNPNPFSIINSENVIGEHIFCIFKFGEKDNVLKNVYKHSLEELVKELSKNGEKVKLVFEGHVDSIGTLSYDFVKRDRYPDNNLNLSDRRTRKIYKDFMNSVKVIDPELKDCIVDTIINNMVDKQELQIILKNGEPVTLGDNSQPLGRNFNRRAIIKVLKP